jgi:hypothetical protein
MDLTTTEQVSLESLKEYCEDLMKAIDTSLNADVELGDTVEILFSALDDFRKARWQSR